MPIEVSCECGGRFRAKDELAGRRVKCPKCGAVLTIPTPPIDLSDFDEEPSVKQHVPLPTRPASAADDSWDNDDDDAPPRRALPVMAGPLLGGRPAREWLYLVLAITLIPLLVSTFHDQHETLRDRLKQTLSTHPEVRERLRARLDSGHLTERALFSALPDHRFDGAWLSYGSEVQWLYALIAAAAFFGLAVLMIPAATTKPLHVFFTGLFTGTAGVLLLLLVQLIAAGMRGHVIIPRSIVGLIFLVLKGIQLSYDAANDPNSNFFLSFLGFTLGVGLCEEICKALPLLWHYRHRATLDWRGACLWGFLSGVGFGVSEAIMYSANHYNGIAGGETYLVRFISCIGLHGIWAAAAGIFICKHQNLIQDAENWYSQLTSAAALVSVPMVLHGLYDTMLKKEMNGAALCVAIVSFAWLVFQVEQARRQEQQGTTSRRAPAYA
ncbi:MAG TPA: PrsW family glutamic-type intramembrane protease [Tepidisphaeraceae bacterium]|jgi:RsiW-degrading membrane proteinase PrsW (M82 family)